MSKKEAADMMIASFDSFVKHATELQANLERAIINQVAPLHARLNILEARVRVLEEIAEQDAQQRERSWSGGRIE